MTRRALERLVALRALERLPDPPELRTPAGIPRGAVPRLPGAPDRWRRYWLLPIRFANWRAVERRREGL